MIKVLILKSWDYPDLLRQTPENKGIWDGVAFTLDKNSDYDYVLSLDRLKEKTTLHVFKENLWRINQEPPNEYFAALESAPEVFYRVFTTNPKLKVQRFTPSQPAIPWFIDKSYDYLKKCPPPQKEFSLSCVSSLKSVSGS